MRLLMRLQQMVYNAMNKIRAQRYPSLGQLSRSPRQNSLSLKKVSHSQAVTILNQKESHIEMIKRRISALCIKDDKISHRTVNNDLKCEEKFKVKQESLQIKVLLEKQRKKDAQNLQDLKNRNLKSRMENYYRAKVFKKDQMENKRQQSHLERTRSRQNDRIIISNRERSIQEKRHLKQEVNKSEQYAKSERSRLIQARQRSVQESQKRDVEHLLNLGSIKDTQIDKLGELELMMVQRNTSSRMAYQASIDRLKMPSRKSSSNYYRPSEVIRSARGKSRVTHSHHD